MDSIPGPPVRKVLSMLYLEYRAQLGWLPVDSFIEYRSLLSLFQDYYTGRGVPLNPEFEFGRTHSYATRCPVHRISTLRFKKSFSQRHFRHSTSTWWNSLPLKLFQNLNMFRRCLFTHLLQGIVV